MKEAAHKKFKDTDLINNKIAFEELRAMYNLTCNRIYNNYKLRINLEVQYDTNSFWKFLVIFIKIYINLKDL